MLMILNETSSITDIKKRSREKLTVGKTEFHLVDQNGYGFSVAVIWPKKADRRVTMTDPMGLSEATKMTCKLVAVECEAYARICRRAAA